MYMHNTMRRESHRNDLDKGRRAVFPAICFQMPESLFISLFVQNCKKLYNFINTFVSFYVIYNQFYYITIFNIINIIFIRV